MSNLDKYRQVLCDVLGVGPEQLSETALRKTSTWGSLNHIVIVTQLEEIFGCSFSPDDIFSFLTYEDGIRLLRSKGVDV